MSHGCFQRPSVSVRWKSERRNKTDGDGRKASIEEGWGEMMFLGNFMATRSSASSAFFPYPVACPNPDSDPPFLRFVPCVDDILTCLDTIQCYTLFPVSFTGLIESNDFAGK